MSVSEIRYFIFENYYKRTGFSMEKRYYSTKRQRKKDLLATKLIGKIPDPCNTKKTLSINYKEKTSVKQSETRYQPKTFENLNIFDINQLLQTIQKLYINYPRL